MADMVSLWLTNMWESSATARAIIMMAGLLVLLMVFGMVLLKLRKKYFAKADESDEAAGFSIETLEKMRKAGNISDEEFRRLRRVALGLDSPAAKSDNVGLTSGLKEADEDNGTSRA